MGSRPWLLFVLFFLSFMQASSQVAAYSTAWCVGCHQFLVVNEGILAFNGSKLEDLTWGLQAKDLNERDFMDFIQTVAVANAGNLTLVYAFPYDMLYMAVYNGTRPIVLKPVLSWYVGYVKDLLFYNGSMFFVASTGGAPHDASDSVYRVDPSNLVVTGSWGLAWDARERINPENAGISPYSWVDIGVDDKGRLWARVRMVMPNATLYYLYNGSNFTPTDFNPVIHVPRPRAPFVIKVTSGILYDLPYLLPGYAPTRYLLVKNGTETDITDRVQELAYSVKPLEALYGFWDEARGEWVVSFGMYGLAVTYAVNGSCREPVHLRGLPLASYNDTYVLLSNGTLTWGNYSVKTPTRSEFWLNCLYCSGRRVSVGVYLKGNRPVIAFPWVVYGNGSIRKGFIAYEVTDKGFLVFNTTDERELGQNLVPPRTVPKGNGGSMWNNVTGTLIVDETNKSAFLITERGKVPVNFTVAKGVWSVIVGNGTFLLLDDNVYIVPPYDRPLRVLSLPLCGEETAPESGGIEWMVLLVVLVGVLTGAFVLWRGR